MRKLLLIDIGNTNIVVGGFCGESITFEFRVKSDLARTLDEYDAIFSSLIDQRAGKESRFDGAIISSVVPPLTPTFVRLVKDRFALDSLVVSSATKTGLTIKLPDPASVGADRIVNAVAAKCLYGTPALVIDFGTATSFDYVDREGSYLGGIIAPGPRVALESLVRRTAKLPSIELSWPARVIGNGTVPAMQSGIVLGYASLVDGLIERAIAEVGEIPHIVATGGLGELFASHSTLIKSYDPHLTLKGMRIISEQNLLS